MLSTSDEEYQDAKRIKLGLSQVAPPFAALKEWVEHRYPARVLNIYYEQIKPDNRPRLSIGLDGNSDLQAFERTRFAWDTRKAKAIAKKFIQLVESEGYDYETEHMFVVFSSFERVARDEANERVSEQELRALKRHFPNQHLWTIATCFSRVVFFFYTEDEKQEAVAIGIQEAFKSAYQRVIQPYDEFGYLRRTPIEPQLDSKENFDSRYQGSWFSYWR